MNNFKFQNPTKLIFGRGKLDTLPRELSQYGKTVLLVYGSGSILRNGIYYQVMKKLKEIDAEVHELSGVKSNPHVSTVQKGVDICKRENIEFILAVGGGSTIDCAKAIAIGAKSNANIWDIIKKRAKISGALPIGTVLTIAATGSEMNRASVITNRDLKEKITWGSSLIFPKFSILDPTHTVTVPKQQTVYGIVDIMSHVMENYFHNSPNTPIQDRFCESILKTMIEMTPKLINDLENYEYRETVMLSGTLALNDMINMGCRCDWTAHHIEHAVSAVCDIPHAAGIAVLFPRWMKYVINQNQNISRFKQFAVNVFQVDEDGKSDLAIAQAGVERLEAFWKELGAPTLLSEFQVTSNQFDLIADKAVSMFPETPNFSRLSNEDVKEILKLS